MNDKSSGPFSSSFFVSHVIFNCITDTNFLRIIRKELDLNIITNKEKKFILKLLFQYFDDYRQAPGDLFGEVFEEQKDKVSKNLYEKSYDIVSEIITDIDHSNKEYILNRIHEYIDRINFEKSLIQAAELQQKGKTVEAKDLILKTLKKTNLQTQAYVDFFEEKSFIDKRVEGKTYRMKTNIEPLDEKIGGFNPGWLIVYLGATKCFKFDTLISMANGTQKTIKDIYRDKDKKVLTLDKNGKIVKGRIINYFDNGIKPCYRLTTISGRSIEVTANHPFLTLFGWKELNQLHIGDYIYVSRFLEKGIFLSKIYSIEYTGDFQTYDVEVDNTHNLIANYIIAHNSGKSRNLINSAVEAIRQKLNVLYVTLEMSYQETADAIDQVIGFLGTDPGKPVNTLERDSTTGKYKKVNKIIDTIYDTNIVKKARKRLRKQGTGKLYLIHRPSNTFNYLDLEVMMDQIEEDTGTLFDVVIVDYLGEMGPVGKEQDKKSKIAGNTAGLKALAQKRNQIYITAQQGNRKALGAKVFKPEQISDAIEPVFIADLVLAICMTSKEEALNLYRIYIALYRHGPKGDMVPLYRDIACGMVARDTGYFLDHDSEDSEEGEEKEEMEY